MGRKRKRRRKIDPSAERADPEPADEEVEEEDSTTTNTPMVEPLAAVEREEVSEGEDIGKLLQPFTRDELLNILTDACLRDPALLSRLAASAASDAAHRRLFVHGLGPGATSAALAAAFAPFGTLDECHVVADRGAGRCRGYGFVTFRHRSDAHRALADCSKRVDGRPVACQLASLGPVEQSFSDCKLFVDNVPERAAHDDLKGFFSRFGEIEEGPLGADRTTGLFRGYAIFFYKTAEGLRKALEEPTKVFDGCELQCRRAHKASNRKHAAAPADTGAQSNGASAAAALPAVQPKDSALASKLSLLSSNLPICLTSKGSSPATDTVLFRHNAPAGGAGILGAPPVAMATTVLTSLQKTSSTPPTRCEDTGTPPVAPAVGPNKSPSSVKAQVLGAVKDSLRFSSVTSTSASRTGQWSTRPGLIQHYLGR